MADFVSHHLFGQQALCVFPVPAQTVAALHPVCFRWGCQGPDPLFYRKVTLGSPLHHLGTRMHSEKTGDLFAALAHGVYCLTGDAQEIAAAYFYGFLCHYALDSEIHPYVYCRQHQLCTANEKLSASAVHCQIEGDIDAALYERQFHEPVTEFRPGEHYALEHEEKAVLACLLHAVLMRVYGEDVSTADLRKSFDEMLSWEIFLYQEHPFIYRSAQKAERLLKRGALFSGHMKTEPPVWDVLNMRRGQWTNLWQPEEIRHDSVPELFGLARIRAAALAGQYAAQFDSDILLHLSYPIPFDSGNPKALAR